MSKSQNTVFTILAPYPIDTRMQVATVSDLGKIAVKFNHLRTHVVDEDIDYRYYSATNKWEKVNSKADVYWGDIQGDLEDQTDLINKFSNYALKTHTHEPEAPAYHTHPPEEIDGVGSVIWERPQVAPNFIITGSSPTEGLPENTPVWTASNGLESFPVPVESIVVFNGFTINSESKSLEFNFEETDPTVPSYVKSITEQDISRWNMAYEYATVVKLTSQLTNDGATGVSRYVELNEFADAPEFIAFKNQDTYFQGILSGLAVKSKQSASEIAESEDGTTVVNKDYLSTVKLDDITAGEGIEIDKSDPLNPVISAPAEEKLWVDLEDTPGVIEAGKAVIGAEDGESLEFYTPFFSFEQGSPATLWTINHNLGRLPSVTIVDSAGTEVQGAVVHTDKNNLTISFNAGFSGFATLN